MLSFEKKIINHIEKYITYYFISTISFLGLFIRYLGKTFLTSDMRGFLLPWWKEISNLGDTALSTQVGNYNLAYQLIIYLSQGSPLNPISTYKAISSIFDYVLAIACGLLVLEFVKSNKKFIFTLVYSSVLLFPTVFLNSAFWGQCDSIYCSFIILGVLFLVKNKFNLSFVMIGFAFAFKLQTIFILPLFCFYYFRNKSFSIIRMFMFIISSMYLWAIPGLVAGRNFLDPIKIYLIQSEYKYLWLNFPSFWTIIAPTSSDTHSLFKSVCIFLTFAILASILFYLIYKDIIITNDNILAIAIITIYTCLLFMPNMHDRYSYLLDILLILTIFLKTALVYFSIIPLLSSILIYSSYLFNYGIIPIQVIAIFYFLNYVFLVLYFLKTSVLIKSSC